MKCFVRGLVLKQRHKGSLEIAYLDTEMAYLLCFLKKTEEPGKKPAKDMMLR